MVTLRRDNTLTIRMTFQGLDRRQAQAVVKAADELRELAPDAGTYVAESSFFERDWQRAY